MYRRNNNNGEQPLKTVKHGAFKGTPTLSLPDGSRYGFTMGPHKAHVALRHLEEIRAFAAKYPEANDVETPRLREADAAEAQAAADADARRYEDECARAAGVADGDAGRN